MTKEHTHYDHWHSGHTEDNDISSSWHMFSKENIAKLDQSNKVILEIGCGRGGFSNYLAGLKPAPLKIYACDYSESALKIAKEKYGDFNNLVSWQLENIQDMSFEANSIDIAISCETLEHIPDAGEAIKELFRVIKPNGHLILTCPSYFNIFGLWCLYRWIIRKPYDEGGQPFVKYIQMPFIYWKLVRAGFKIKHFHASEIIIPARPPIHLYNSKVPKWLSVFGFRTYYVATKVR